MGERLSGEPKISFLAGFLLGRRSRRRSGLGCQILLAALLADMTAFASLIGAPMAWHFSRQTARLPQSGINLMMAFLCGGMAFLLLLLGGGLQLIGR